MRISIFLALAIAACSSPSGPAGPTPLASDPAAPAPQPTPVEPEPTPETTPEPAPAPAKQIGSACQPDLSDPSSPARLQADCPDGSICAPFPAACARRFAPTRSAPDGSLCVDSSRFGRMCFAGCASDSDCRNEQGYVCDPGVERMLPAGHVRAQGAELPGGGAAAQDLWQSDPAIYRGRPGGVSLRARRRPVPGWLGNRSVYRQFDPQHRKADIRQPAGRIHAVHVVWAENRAAAGGIAYARCVRNGTRCGANESVSDTPFASYRFVRHAPSWLGEYFSILADDRRRRLHVVWTQTVEESGVLRARIFHTAGPMR